MNQSINQLKSDQSNTIIVFDMFLYIHAMLLHNY